MAPIRTVSRPSGLRPHNNPAALPRRGALHTALATLALLAGTTLAGAATPPGHAAWPSADGILAKYESFLGGAGALGKVKARTIRTRRIEFGSTPADETLVRYSSRPMLSIMHHEALDGTFISYTNGCDGTGGWVGYGLPANSNAPRAGGASTDGVCEQEQYYYEYLPLDLARMHANVHAFDVKGMLDIVTADAGVWGALAGGNGRDIVPAGRREAYIVLASPARPSDAFTWLYFDAATGALLRRADAGRGPAPQPPGQSPRYTDFLQYRKVGDGTLMPFQFVTTAPNSQVRGITTGVTDSIPGDATLFLRPRDIHRADKGS